MCYSGKCKHEDHFGNCQLDLGKEMCNGENNMTGEEKNILETLGNNYVRSGSIRPEGSSYESIPEQWNKMENERKEVIEEILTHFYAAFDEDPDHEFEKALIYSISKYIKTKHAFIEPILYDTANYRKQAKEAIDEIGEYNPFVKTRYAIRETDDVLSKAKKDLLKGNSRREK